MSALFGRSREVVCHDTTFNALSSYSARRDQLCPRPASASFFVSTLGRRLAHHTVYATFNKLELDCRMESACETCSYFATGPEFVPVLIRQRDHARDHDQRDRAALFDRLLAGTEGATDDH
ncbi:MAG: hypothetical protein ACRD0G_16525 [Acidimicrobiales bacterium]